MNLKIKKYGRKRVKHQKLVKDWVIFVKSYFKTLLFILIISLLLFATHIYYEYQIKLGKIEAGNELYIANKKLWIEQLFQTVTSDLYQLKNSTPFKRYIRHKNPDSLGGVSEFFTSMANVKDIYDSISYIDEAGRERLVVHNRDGSYVSPERLLQSRVGENFFIQAQHLTNNRVYISDVEAAMKHGKKEVPNRIIIHSAVSVYNQYEIPSGIISITLDGSKILASIIKRNFDFAGNLYLVSADGSWVFGKGSENDWDSESLKIQGFKKKFPKDWSQLSQKNEGILKSKRGIFVFKTIFFPEALEMEDLSSYPSNQTSNHFWKFAIFYPQSQIQGIIFNTVLEELYYIIPYFIGILILTAYLALRFGRKTKKEFEVFQSESTLRMSQIIAKLGNWTYDVRNERWAWSDELVHIIGNEYNREKSGIENLLGNVHPEDFYKLKQFLLNTIERYQASQITYKLVLPGGRTKHLSLNTDISKDYEGAYRIIGVIQDITEIKKTEEELKKLKNAAESSNQAKTEFLNNIITEINSSIKIIQRFSRVLKERVYRETDRYYLKSIFLSSQLLMNVFNDILDLSSVELGNQSDNVRNVNMKNMVADIREVFRLQMFEKGLKFFIDIDPYLPKNILVDEARLRQILFSLVGNAIRFTSKGFILITCRKKFLTPRLDSMDLILTVEDTGSGINEIDKNNLLNYLSSLKDSEDFWFQKGLGFSIIKRLLYLMQGEIEVNSSPGRGTIIRIRIPNVKIQKEKKSKEESTLKDAFLDNISLDDFSNSRILLLSNSGQKEQLKSYLLSAGVTLYETTDYKKCLEILETNSPHCILVYPSEENIKELLFVGNLKKAEVFKNFPMILFLTEKLKNKKGIIELKNLANSIIRWPMNKEELLLSLSRYLPFTGKQEDSETIMVTRWMDDQERKDMEELVHIMENKMSHMWEKVSNVLTKDDLEEFSQNIIELGRQYNFRPLFKWGTELNNQIQVFDTISILNTLKEFPYLLKTLDNPVKV